MICIIAAIVFGVLAIFSASFRPLAKEAFDCTFRLVTFRKCKTNLDDRIKGKIVGKLMKKSPLTAGLVFKYFNVLSVIFVILFFASLAYTGYSTYNYIQYGNCYGPEDTGGFCIFNALEGEHFSELQKVYDGEIIPPDVDDDPGIGPEDAPVTIIEFGCYSCPYTRDAQPVVNEILEQYEGKIRYVFRDFPIEQLHGSASVHSEAANCALEQGQDKFWEMHEKIFDEQEACGGGNVHPDDHIVDAAQRIGLNMLLFHQCMNSHKYMEEIEKDFDEGIKAGVSGTPTFFINGRTIIGPKPIKAFQKIIDEELEIAEV
ncbi:DsbA family protein [Candidatus Woesearchaeota archaeon]|nr:DsbA family protein [Candidatus Woesearchaeota archaeon]